MKMNMIQKMEYNSETRETKTWTTFTLKSLLNKEGNWLVSTHIYVSHFGWQIWADMLKPKKEILDYVQKWSL